MVAKMTQAEYEAFQKKTGHREPQKVTTYYVEAKKEEDGLKHHAERREHNRKLRDKQMPRKEKVRRTVQTVKEKLTPAANWLKGKIGQVAENARRSQEPGGFSITPPRNMGMDFSLGPFGPEPSRQRAQLQEPRSRSRGGRRQPPREPREPEGPDWRAMGEVPDSVKRWMF